MTKRSCSVYEYGINKNYLTWDLKNQLNLDNDTAKILDINDNYGIDDTIILKLRIDLPDWSKGDRTKELQLDVYTEYYVWSGVNLVGNVGGQLGLFIGFSFLGSWVWLMSKAQMLWSCVTWNDNAL